MVLTILPAFSVSKRKAFGLRISGTAALAGNNPYSYLVLKMGKNIWNKHAAETLEWNLILQQLLKFLPDARASAQPALLKKLCGCRWSLIENSFLVMALILPSPFLLLLPIVQAAWSHREVRLCFGGVGSLTCREHCRLTPDINKILRSNIWLKNCFYPQYSLKACFLRSPPFQKKPFHFCLAFHCSWNGFFSWSVFVPSTIASRLISKKLWFQTGIFQCDA